MSYSNFRPEVWSKILLTERERECVLRNLCYTGPYLGEIKKMGDTLHIAGIGRPTIRNYVEGTTPTRETLNDWVKTLSVDQAKYFDFKVGDVDQTQAAGDILGAQLIEARRAMAATIDDYLAGLYNAQIGVDGSSNPIYVQTVTEAAFNSANAYSTITLAEEKLREGNVASNMELALVVHPKVYSKLQLAKIVYGRPNESVVDNGNVGNILPFKVYVSNAVKVTQVTVGETTTDHYHCMAMTKQAIAFAEQIPPKSIEQFRDPDDFGTVIRGFSLYGATILRPSDIVHLDLALAAEVTV